MEREEVKCGFSLNAKLVLSFVCCENYKRFFSRRVAFTGHCFRKINSSQDL